MFTWGHLISHQPKWSCHCRIIYIFLSCAAASYGDQTFTTTPQGYRLTLLCLASAYDDVSIGSYVNPCRIAAVTTWRVDFKRSSSLVLSFLLLYVSPTAEAVIWCLRIFCYNVLWLCYSVCSSNRVASYVVTSRLSIVRFCKAVCVF